MTPRKAATPPASPAYPPAAGSAGVPGGKFTPRPGSTPGARPRPKVRKAQRPRGPAAEWVDPRTLIPWADNPRQRPAAAIVQELAASIRSVGWGAPILARRRDRRIVAGHTRHAAALELRLDVVPVRFLDLTDTQAAALAVADNRLQERGRWDRERLAAVLKDLPDAARAWAGYTGKELEAALGAAPTLDASASPAARNPTPYTIRLDDAQRAAFCAALEEARKARPKLRAAELVAEWAGRAVP